MHHVFDAKYCSGSKYTEMIQRGFQPEPSSYGVAKVCSVFVDRLINISVPPSCQSDLSLGNFNLLRSEQKEIANEGSLDSDKSLQSSSS
ncbi:hypothetical protein Plhal304r1_c031g0101041 [Plasmopara halstedii]